MKLTSDSNFKRPADFSPISDDILEKTIIPHFEEVVEKHAKRPAIKSLQHNLSYRELNNAINDLAHQIIRELGDDQSPVAFLFEDEVFSTVALMAVLKSGRAFTGLHLSSPVEQLKVHLEDSTASLLITCTQFKELAQTIRPSQKQVRILYLDEIKVDSSAQNPGRPIASNAPFGLFYTSGSTGRPKGILAGHLNKSQSTQFRTNEMSLSPSDRISLMTSVCLGASTTSLLGALMSGALLWIYDLKANSAQAALDWISSEELTIFRCSPSIFRTIFGLAPAGLVFPKLRFVLLGGEPLSNVEIDLFKAHTPKDCILINHYAATEVGSICHYPIYHHTPPFNGFVPAGYPALGREILVVDDAGQIVQDGVEGEILVKSRFLSLGYWRQPELTAQKFHADPHQPGVLTYHTGDRGRWRSDGVLETLGRKDVQVKIRGYRVELETIDLALRSLQGVKDAATLVHKSGDRPERLVAYVSMSDPQYFSVHRFRKHLSTQLPEYMIPSVFISLDALPRTASGKLARLDLPEPTNQRPELDTPYVAPRTKMEAEVALIWQELLGLESVGINDSFFELGGDSLSVLEMALKVEKLSSRRLPSAFFKSPTISSLIGLLEAQGNESDEGKFAIKSYKKRTARSKKQRKTKKRWPSLKKLVTGKYSPDKAGRLADRILDLMIARYIITKPYLEAKTWSVKWSRNEWVRDVLYQRRKAMFSQWVASLKDSQVDLSEAFSMSVLTNLNFGIIKFLGKKEKRVKNDLEAYRISRHPYWRTMVALIEAAPVGQPNEHFPIEGVDHLLRAREQGKGVILLAFHGVPSAGRLFSLERLVGLDGISTISYHIPRYQSQYYGQTEKVPDTVATALNAEIAFFAQRELQKGKVINIVSDTHDLQGRTYKVSLAGRIYQIKSGFAELAINTGAVVIPHVRYCLPDGRIKLSLQEPLDPGTGDRLQQVMSLLNGYAAFIENSWKAHPEALRWVKIQKHLQRPLS